MIKAGKQTTGKEKQKKNKQKGKNEKNMKRTRYAGGSKTKIYQL